MLKALILTVSVLGFSTAYADEVVVHHDDDGPTVSKTVEHRSTSDGCESKTVHKEADNGDSKTIHKTNCD